MSDADKAILERSKSIICVASPSSVEAIFNSGVQISSDSCFLSIGKTTANAIEKKGHKVLVSNHPSVFSMIELLESIGNDSNFNQSRI